MWKTIAMLALLAAAGSAQIQQVPDVDFDPPLGQPTYAEGAGPRVAIDAAHNNFHTVGGRYLTFAKLLRRDGYRVSGSGQPFTAESLAGIDILVIANASSPADTPGAPAFTAEEAAAVEAWVRSGGSLMLVADHQPWPAANQVLASRFGIEYANAYAYDGPADNRQGSLVYRKSDGSLASHAVTSGVDTVADFLGSAFRVTVAHVALLRMSDQAVAQSQMGAAGSATAKPIPGYLQGALIEAGQGRVAVFGEAAMFSAQLQGPQRRPMGMNAPEAKDNPRFVLNVLHWLSR